MIMKIVFYSKEPSIKDVPPNFRFLGYPPSPWAFFVPPSLPLWGDVFYGWSLMSTSFTMMRFDAIKSFEKISEI